MTSTPDTLAIGAKIKTPSGQIVTVARIAGEDSSGYEMYRLRYSSGILGRQTWTVEQLLDAGAKLQV